MNARRRIAITGAAGFLGRRAAEALVADGHVVLAIDRAPPPLAGAEAAAADITDDAAMRALFDRFRPDAVLHLAALLTPDSAADIVAATRVNALGTAIVFEAARRAGARRIAYASSMAALGAADITAGDHAVPDPKTIYGATKAYAEHLATALPAIDPALELIGLRFGYVYGPGRDRGWRVVQTMVESAWAGAPGFGYPAIEGPIDWTWIDDAAEVARRAVTWPVGAGHTILNVAGDKRSLAEAAAHLAVRCPGFAAKPAPGEVPLSAWAFANDRLFATLGYVPHTPMEEGIDRLLGAGVLPPK